jgi:ATP/maltotriose-dependent transcriptional regulator MalT/two-component SAPR family response regulator
MTSSSNIPISHTKVIVPRRRDELLMRPRLLNLMFDLLDKKLILVSAPAGYGKTSLLIDFSYQTELPVCWLSLDRHDQEPQRFASYFIHTLEEQFPGLGFRSKSVLNTMKTLNESIEALVSTLVGEIYEHIPQHFVLVLDDYHLVNEVPVIQDFVSRFIQLVDENCHLVISSRHLTQMPDLPLMVARDIVGGMDLSELAFRTDEIQALFAQNYNLNISEDRAKELVDETEGWITGLQLSGLGITQGMTDRLRVAKATGVSLFDYLGEQVLNQQSEEIYYFLLRSSMIEVFDANLCEEVLGPLYPGRNNWQDWINTVIQRNLFALPVGIESGWVRYHHLFRDFLQDRLQKEFADEIPLILGRLARVYEIHGEWVKAYHIQKRLGDMDALAEVIERASPHLVVHSLATLDSWLKDLPPSILASRPGILSVRGVTEYMQGNLQAGLELFNRAEKSFRQKGDVSGLALTLVRRATVHRFLGDYKAALKDAEKVLEITEASDQMQMIFANALRQKGLSLFRQGKSRQSVKILKRALEYYVRQNDNINIPVMKMETGMAYRVIGKHDETKRLYYEALDIWKKEGNLTWQANVLNNLGVLHHMQGEYEKAVIALDEGLLCARKGGFSARLEAALHVSLGDVYTEVEDFDLAHQHYHQGKRITEETGDQFLSNYIGMVRASLYMHQQDVIKANQLLMDVSSSISSGGSPYESGLYYLVQGQLYLQEAEIKKAVQVLKEAERCFKNDEHGFECSKSQILLAAAYSLEGNQGEARMKIKEAFSIENRADYRMLIFIRHVQSWLGGIQKDIEVGQSLQSVFRKSQRIYKEMPEIRRRIRRLTRTMEVPDAKLKIRAFGRAKVSLGGKTLTLSDWQTQSVRDLFFYFLMMTEPLTKEQIGLVFWPEVEEPAKLKMRFKNEMYRLRRAVGREAILFENNLYSFNRALDFEYDVDAFNSLIFQAKMAKDSNLKSELLKRAVNLVNGHLLEDLDATWIWPERERLNQEYLEALFELAKLYTKDNRYQKSLEMYHRAIQHYPTSEEGYILAMNLYMQMNDRVNAIRLYETYAKTMEKELNLPPSPEMVSCYERLLQ